MEVHTITAPAKISSVAANSISFISISYAGDRRTKQYKVAILVRILCVLVNKVTFYFKICYGHSTICYSYKKNIINLFIYLCTCAWVKMDISEFIIEKMDISEIIIENVKNYVFLYNTL